GENSGPGGREGATYLIDTRLDPGEAGRRQRLVADDLGQAAFFGQAVALDDGLALIGAPSFDGPGAAYIFDALTGRQLATIDAPNSAEEESFGYKLALSGNLALISSIGRVQPSGNSAPDAVYVYRIEQPARIPLPAPALLLVGAMGALALAARRA
ncbi:MAG: FG-GAP repeat protein, partial [Pseudomonadota bacterium]